jgi:ribonuclease G
MSKEMVISANPHETRVAILEEGQLCEYYVEREKEFALVGSIYKGRVTRVLPGMQSAFVDIGLDGDAFLYVSDFLEGIEEFEPMVATVEEKVKKMQDEGGSVFAEAGAAPLIEPPDVESATVAIGELPGEVVAPVTSPAPPPSHDRPRFDSRSRHGYGRDFGRRGGRRGGRGGRGDRRYGRELPPSKYASHRPYDATPPVSNGEAPIPTILPGEHLARFRAPGEAASTEPEAAVRPAAETHEPVRRESTERATEPRASYASGLEPLPGETLSRWPHVEHSSDVAAHAEPAPKVSESEHLVAHDEPEPIHAAQSQPEPVAIRPDITLTEEVVEVEESDLSEEEASSLAEQVAEAQSEEAARQAAVRGFAAEENEADEVQEIEAAMGSAPGGRPSEEVETDELRAAREEDEAEAEAAAEEVLESLEETEHALELEAGIPPVHEDLPVPDASPIARPPESWQARVHDDFRSRMQHPARRQGRDRGRRPHRGAPYRPQPRRPQLISELLKQGQEIIVQIAKEPLGKKGARITSHVALPGRSLVYMPTLDHTGVSRKIASAEERARLRHLVNDAKGSAGGGFIVRTAAGSASPEEVRADVEFLTRTWSEIKSRAEQRKAPSLLHRDLNLVERMLRDHINTGYTAVWVDTEDEYTKVVDFMNRFQPALVNRVKLYTKDTPIFEEFGIQQEIDKGLRPKVWLKSGGYIVINHTEALVAIDVNTGKFVGKGSTRLEDTIVRTNLEAVKEIVRQMRLRDLGGIIIIDFIDMEERRNREKVMAALEEALKADRAPSKMLRFNEFGLIAITRKRTKQALERTLCQPCPYCTGSGMVKSVPTLCYEIQTEARKMAPEVDSASITLRVHPEIAKALKTRESALVEELERWTKKSVIIQADPTLHWEQYDIY